MHLRAARLPIGLLALAARLMAQSEQMLQLTSAALSYVQVADAAALAPQESAFRRGAGAGSP